MSDYTNFEAEVWLGEIQDQVVARTVRSSVGTNELVSDKTVHSPYVDNAVADTTTDGSFTAGSNDTTDESFTVSTQIISSERIKSGDAMASHYGLNSITARNHSNAIARREDQMMFSALASTLTNSVTDGDLASATNSGGTNAIILSSANAEETVDLALQKAYESLMPQDEDVVAVLDFKTARFMKEFLTGTGNNVADQSLNSGFGYFGQTANGISVYTSQLLEQEVVLSMATQPTADDTVVVNGVTFTFKASPSAAGEVDLGADVDATRANLAAAINGGSGAGSDYIEISSANRKAYKLNFVSATNDDSADTLTIKCYGSLTVSETLTDGTDAFGDTYKNVPVFKRGIAHNYRIASAGTDILGGTYQVSNGLAFANKTVGGFTGVEQELTELYGTKIWNNMAGFGSIMKIKA